MYISNPGMAVIMPSCVVTIASATPVLTKSSVLTTTVPAIVRNVVSKPLTVPSRPSSGNALITIGSTVSHVPARRFHSASRAARIRSISTR